MVKPMTSNKPANGSDPRMRVNTGQTETNEVGQPPMIDSEQRRKRILVVDDNSDIALTLRLGLENTEESMQVNSYDNPVKTLVEFKPNFYDLVLVDINMPLMNGFELCQKLLQKDINIKVCFMTSGEINMDAVREVHPIKSIGCFIKKPITTDALVKRIRQELE
jgi:DNA-binding response OmpR family regulator